jgi:hypothetical protein
MALPNVDRERFVPQTYQIFVFALLASPPLKDLFFTVTMEVTNLSLKHRPCPQILEQIYLKEVTLVCT